MSLKKSPLISGLFFYPKGAKERSDFAQKPTSHKNQLRTRANFAQEPQEKGCESHTFFRFFLRGSFLPAFDYALYYGEIMKLVNAFVY